MAVPQRAASSQRSLQDTANESRSVRFAGHSLHDEAAASTRPALSKRPANIQRFNSYAARHSTVMDPRIGGSTWTNVKPEIDLVDRHELFLLGDGEKKVEMETVTRESSHISN